MNLNTIQPLIIVIISYISFAISYIYLYCKYYLIFEIPNKDPFILTKYYGMLRFQPVGMLKLLV